MIPFVLFKRDLGLGPLFCFSPPKFEKFKTWCVQTNPGQNWHHWKIAQKYSVASVFCRQSEQLITRFSCQILCDGMVFWIIFVSNLIPLGYVGHREKTTGRFNVCQPSRCTHLVATVLMRQGTFFIKNLNKKEDFTAFLKKLQSDFEKILVVRRH